MIQECRALGIRVVVIDTAKNDGISSHMSSVTSCISDENEVTSWSLMVVFLCHGFNLFFIKVQPLPCQSNPFISLSMDCSCQPMITVHYLDNSLLIIPTSEKLPFVNYIALMKPRCTCFRVLSRPPSLCHAQ